MDYYAKRRAYVNIAHELQKNGWKLYGYKEDQSDMMTDYYSPAYWTGCASKNGYLIVNDYKKSDGHDITETINIPVIKCKVCGGTGIEPGSDDWNLAKARQNPTAFHDWHDKHKDDGTVSLFRDVVSPLYFRNDGKLKCNKCGGKGEYSLPSKGEKRIIDHYPAYPETPKRVMFFLISPSGRVIKQWRALKPYLNDYMDKDALGRNLTALMSEIDNLISPKKQEVIVESINSSDLEVVDYSEKAVAIFGNTKPIKDQLKELGGRFNPRLNHNGGKSAGWVFPMRKKDEILKLLK